MSINFYIFIFSMFKLFDCADFIISSNTLNLVRLLTRVLHIGIKNSVHVCEPRTLELKEPMEGRDKIQHALISTNRWVFTKFYLFSLSCLPH